VQIEDIGDGNADRLVVHKAGPMRAEMRKGRWFGHLPSRYYKRTRS
jgi:hypothetical protein